MEERRIIAALSPAGVGRFLRRVVWSTAVIVGCGLVVFLLCSLSRDIDYHAMMRAVHETPRKVIWVSISFTALSYLALIGRDECALIYIGSKVSATPMLLASFCGSALGNAIGLGALTGEAVRDRVYGAVGLGSEQIDLIMIFIDMGFGAGLLAFAGASMMLAGPALASRLSIPRAAPGVAGALLIFSPHTAANPQIFHPALPWPGTGIGTEFLADGEKIEVTRHNSRSELSPVPVERAHRPTRRAFCAHPLRMPQTLDCVAERGVFEPPVPRGLRWAELTYRFGALFVTIKSSRTGENYYRVECVRNSETDVVSNASIVLKIVSSRTQRIDSYNLSIFHFLSLA